MGILKGMVAGFAATVVLALIIMMKESMGLMPELDVIGMFSTMLGSSTTTGWIAHFLIGTVVWGGLFAIVDPFVPGYSHWLKGVTLSLAAWLGMIVLMMPMAGKGLFGVELGIMAPVMTMVLHVIFGATLAAVYGMLIGQERDANVHLGTGDRPSL